MGVPEPEFWASLARAWALQVWAGDVRSARRMGLTSCPPQRCLLDVQHGDWEALCRRWGVPRDSPSRFVWMSRRAV